MDFHLLLIHLIYCIISKTKHSYVIQRISCRAQYYSRTIDVREANNQYYTIDVDGVKTKTTTKIIYLKFTKPLPCDLKNKTRVVLSYKSRLLVEDKSNNIRIPDLELMFDSENGYGLVLPDGKSVDNAEDLI